MADRTSRQEADGSEALRPGSTVGRYVVVKPLGAGAMGIVHLAYDPELDRRVALKIMRPEAEGRDQQWLLREAQAMARLSHPNVVSVHDVGTLDERVFMAMEFVAGTTITKWLEQRRRHWQEIRNVFLQAGRGLAAAHRAGLVHGDVKPDNILVDHEGRAYVGDFGLAHASMDLESSGHSRLPPAMLEAAGLGDSQKLLSTVPTSSDGQRGTPAYMAPEQRGGGPADASSDQYSFCVALYQALTGELPKRGGGAGHTPERADVPSWMWRIVDHGLQLQPRDRFASMEHLLAELAYDPVRTRRRWLAAAGIAAAIALAAGGYRQLTQWQNQVCKGAERRLEGVWDRDVQDAIGTSFVATNMPYAAAALTEVTKLLDGYTQRWVAARVDACEASHVRGEQSAKVMDLRMHCLDARLAEVEALTNVLRNADATIVGRAVQASASIPGIERCADSVALVTRVLVPEQTEARTEAEALRHRLARVKALRNAGKYTDALAIAGAVSDAADELGYAPLRAEALKLEGDLQSRAGDAKLGTETTLDALWAAWDGGHDEIAADALTSLVFTLSENLGRYDQAKRYAEHAKATLERIDGDISREAALLRSIGVLHFRKGEFEDARDHHARALDLQIEALGAESVLVAGTHNTLANALNRLGKHDEALSHYQKALEIWEQTVGPHHPSVGSCRNNLGALHYRKGDFAGALMQIQRAYEIRLAALGPDHRDVAGSLGNLGAVTYELGRYDESLEWQRKALTIYRDRNGPDHPQVAGVLINVGVVFQARGELEDARATYAEALRIYEGSKGPDHPHTALAVHNLGRALFDMGRFREALAHHQRALAIRERIAGGDPSEIASSLIQIGRSRVGLGQPAVAIPPLRRALGLLEPNADDESDLAMARFTLARALWDSRRDRAGARALALNARDSLRGRARSEDDLATIEDWIANANL